MRVMFGSIRYVSHSVACARDFNVFERVLRQGYIKPHHKFKAGFSAEGCYALFLHPPSYATLIFDFRDVRELLVPVIYFPLKHYDWYKADGYLVTWHNLAWETELALLEGKTIPLELCREIVITKRKRKLKERLEALGFKVSHQLPPSSLHPLASQHARGWENSELRHELANQYNEWICNQYGLDYEAVKKEFLALVEREETKYRKTCAICQHYSISINISKNSPTKLNTERKCLLSGKETEFDSYCENFKLNLSLFVDINAWKKHYSKP